MFSFKDCPILVQYSAPKVFIVNIALVHVENISSKQKRRKLLLICGFYKVREYYYYNVEYTCTYKSSIIVLHSIPTQFHLRIV